MVALFVALSGTAVAISDRAPTSKRIAKNAIKSKQVKNRSLGGRDLRDGAVKSKQVRDRSLRGVDLREGTLGAELFADGELPAGPRGPVGLRGPAGAQGETGAQGPPGISGYEVVDGNNVLITDTSPVATSVAQCPAGKQPIGVGYEQTGSGGGASPPRDFHVTRMRFDSGGVTVAFRLSSEGASDFFSFRAQAVCASLE